MVGCVTIDKSTTGTMITLLKDRVARLKNERKSMLAAAKIRP
jgi:hypothetical protein